MKKLSHRAFPRPRRFLGSLVGACVACACWTVAAQEAPAPKSPWEKSASLGLTVTDGNSDTLLLTADVLGTRKSGSNELGLGANLSYGENEGEKNNEAASGFVQYNRLFSERTFGYARAHLLHDDIADVDYRLTLSPGVGYYFIKEERTSLSGEIGPGFVLEKQGGQTDEYASVRLAEKFSHKLSDTARVWQSAEVLPQVDDFDNFIVNAEVGLESALTKTVSLRVVLQDTYDNEPAPGRKENDLKLIASLAVKF